MKSHHPPSYPSPASFYADAMTRNYCNRNIPTMKYTLKWYHKNILLQYTCTSHFFRMSTLRLEMYGAIPLLPVYTLMPWKGTTLPFTSKLHTAQEKSVEKECEFCLSANCYVNQWKDFH